MRLFDDFEAVRFPEEDLIFVTTGGYIYYVYRSENHYWWKHKNAGNDHITVGNYQDVSKEEITEAMDGVFPQKETDFMRKCNPSQLWIRDMLALLNEDYPNYMGDYEIYHAVQRFLVESDIRHKSYIKLRDLFDNDAMMQATNEDTLLHVRDLSFAVIGRDIFKKEIQIVDGHDSSSYFWIQPVRIVDDSDTNGLDTVAEMSSAEISIEESDVDQYLTPFLYKYFDEALEANQKRVDEYWEDDEGNEHMSYVTGFEWYLTHNFYTYDSVEQILHDIDDTIDALISCRENEYTPELREKRGFETYPLLYAKNLTQEQIDEYNANRPKTNDTEVELIIDFYRRFIYRMEHMMTVGKEKGYDLISFMGP